MIVLGYIIFGVYQATLPKDRRTIIEWRSAYWILPWLAGLLVFSWLGQYDASTPKIFGITLLATHHIAQWWDLGVITAFSLLIYYWAVNSGLPLAKVQEAVEAVEAEASVELATPLT